VTPIDELIEPLTADEALEKFLATLESIGVPARSWRPGGWLRSMLRGVAITFAGYTSVGQAFIRSGFLELAEGVWLTRVAKYVYGVDRRVATFATGKATFTNTGGGVFNYAADGVRLKNATTGKVYVITEPLSLNGPSQATIAIRAVEVGSASSSAAGTIATLETVLLGVTVTNAEAVYGSDEETDADLRQRCIDKLGAISVRGPRGAYRYAVTSAKRPDGSPVDINRVAISPSSSTGTVSVTCASPSGVPVASDLDYVRDNIEAIARPDSVTATVQAATALVVARTLTVWATRTQGLLASDLAALCLAAIDPVTRSYPIGGYPKPPVTQGYLWEDYVTGLVKNAHPSIYDVDGFGADVPIAPGEVVSFVPTFIIRIVEGFG